MSLKQKMSKYGLTLSEARNLQKWALEVSGAKKFLDTIPKIPKTKKNKAWIIC